MKKYKSLKTLGVVLVLSLLLVITGCQQNPNTDNGLSFYSVKVRTEIESTETPIPDVSIIISGSEIDEQTVTTNSDGEVDLTNLKGEVTISPANKTYNGVDYSFEEKNVTGDDADKTIVFYGVTSVDAGSVEELEEALSDDSIAAINLTENITANINVERDLKINGNGNTITGNLTLGNGNELFIEINDIELSGELLVDVGQGSVDLSNVEISDIVVSSVGSESLNLKGNSVINYLEMNSPWAHLHLEDNATINDLLIEFESIGSRVSGNLENIVYATVYAMQVYFEGEPQTINPDSFPYPIITFAAGSGGSLPSDLPNFRAEDGKIANFYALHSQRWTSYQNYTKTDVEFKFSSPVNIGADSYTLEYSTDKNNWSIYQHNDEDLIVDYDNISISPADNYYYRLRVNGGEKDGYLSNEIYVPLTQVDSYFLDPEISSDFMTDNPSLEAGFKAKSLETGETISNDFLSYQWYRVNPETFEMKSIAGATDLRYNLTDEDMGYYHICRATGDEENIGGFKQVISYDQKKIRNKAYLTEVSSSGFKLNLYKSVPDGIDKEELYLQYWDAEYNGDDIEITSIENIKDNAFFEIKANIPTEAVKIIFGIENHTWDIVTLEGEGYYYPGIDYELPPNFGE